MNNGYRLCVRCVMDTTDPDITFDKNGICNHCARACGLLRLIKGTPRHRQWRLEHWLNQIKLKGSGKKYDCIIGVSGGVDSSFVAYYVKKCGLRPLAVHLDNGWDSELAVKNIELLLKILDIDLKTYVLDWEEFRDLQLSFLKASTPDSEIPTDHAIYGALYRAASAVNTEYIILGDNRSTESIMPDKWSWGYYDWRYMKHLQKTFGSKKLKTFLDVSMWRRFYYLRIKKIKIFSILNYIDYVKQDAISTLNKEIGWCPYGYKHYESIYTRFYQGYILPVKFNYDKRRAHLSSLICAGEMTREQALAELKQPALPDDIAKEDRKFVISKFGLTEEEFENLMKLPKKTFWEYPSYESSRFYSWLHKILKL